MNPTDLLKTEHKAIKTMLSIIEVVCDRLERGKDIPVEHLRDIVGFIQGFADKCHHAKEEDLLFPAIEESGIPRHGGPTGVMLAEHEEGRSYVRKMKEAAEKYGAGNKMASSQFIEYGRNYVRLLTQHIDKEDNILYAIADSRLSRETQKRLEKEFEKVEREVMGPGKHEEFHGLLEKLEKIYIANTGTKSKAE